MQRGEREHAERRTRTCRECEQERRGMEWVPPLGEQQKNKNAGCSNFIKGIFIISMKLLGAPSNLLGALSNSHLM